MNGKKGIAFLKVGDFSFINNSVKEILSSEFPGFQLEIVDCGDLVTRKNPVALFHAILLYGKAIILRKRTLSDCINRTPYFFRKVRSVVRKRLASKQYAFTFQTQSIYDLSLEGIPHFVYTDHTHLANLTYPSFNKELLFADAWIRCEKEIYQQAARVFTMSSNITNSLIRDYDCDPGKIVKVGCGANLNIAPDDMVDSRRYREKTILFVGLEWERKGGPELAIAYSEVLKVHPDAHLNIVGCSPKLSLPNCRIVGKAPPHKIKPFFENAAIFCVPTNIEPFGVVFIEAMAHKLPVVATRLGAIPDFIHEGKNGHLIEPGDTKGLADKLVQLLNEPDLCRTYGEYGYRIFSEKYTWQGIGKHIQNEIRSFLEKK